MTFRQEQVAPGVWRLPLPSRTLPPYDHTNSYLLRQGSEGVLVDIGTDEPDVLQGLRPLLAELGVTKLRALLLTHTHLDHCAGAEWLRERFGMPVYAHPLEPQPFPCEPLEDKRALCGVVAHHTPGHSPGHLSLEFKGVLLVGDLLAAQGSTWVGLPGGNVSNYLASLERVEGIVAQKNIRILGPGHGPTIPDPLRRLAKVRTHRLAREAQVLAALQQPRTLTDLREAVYPGLPTEAVKAADGSLLAQLEKLVCEGRVHQTLDGRYGQTSAEVK